MGRRCYSTAWIGVCSLIAITLSGCANFRLPAIDPTGQRIFSGNTSLLRLHGDRDGIRPSANREPGILSGLVDHHRRRREEYNRLRRSGGLARFDRDGRADDCLLFPDPAYREPPNVPLCAQANTGIPAGCLGGNSEAELENRRNFNATQFYEPSCNDFPYLDDPCLAPFGNWSNDCSPCEPMTCNPTPCQQAPVCGCPDAGFNGQTVVDPGPIQAGPQVQPIRVPPDVANSPTPSVVLSPTRLIAPVGSEVSVVGGIYDPDGFYQRGRPVEWLLNQESVGTLIDAGPNTGERLLSRVVHHKRDRRQSNSVLEARTSNGPQVLNRGTSSTSDDLWTTAGQSWVNVTSSSEGVTRITMLAPELESGRRQQTSSIYWIDGQWAFPPPAVARPGEPKVLTTYVTRLSSPEPAFGWTVRYEIVGGAPAAFDEAGSQVKEVRTDERGQAAVQIFPGNAETGTTQLAVQVIRGGESIGGMDRIVVGAGGTTVTWAGDQLAVRVVGDEQASVGSIIPYQFAVTNTGQSVAEDVVVSSSIPFGLEYAESDPNGQVVGGAIQWRLGAIEPGETKNVRIAYNVNAPGNIRLCARASAQDGAAVEDCLTTRVRTPAFQIDMQGPQAARVGEEVRYRVTVRNTSNQTIDDVLVIDRFDPGLQHAPRNAQAVQSPIERSLGTLEPGAVRTFGITFRAIEPGQQCHSLEVRAPGMVTSREEQCVEVVAAAPTEFAVTTTGPDRMTVGEEETYFIQVDNTGQSALKGINIEYQVDPAFEITDTHGFQVDQGLLFGRLDTEIPPGRRVTLQVTLRGLQEVEAATNRVTAVADGRTETAEVSTVINRRAPRVDPDLGDGDFGRDDLDDGGDFPVDDGIGDAGDLGNGGDFPDDGGDAGAGGIRGGLALAVSAMTQTARVDEVVEYRINFQNNRPVTDKNVILSVQLPPGMELANQRGVLMRYDLPVTPGDGGREIRIGPLRELRPNERLPQPIRIRVVATEAGDKTVRVEATSQRTRAGVTEEVTVSIVE